MGTYMKSEDLTQNTQLSWQSRYACVSVKAQDAVVLNTPRKQTLQGTPFTTFNIIQECNPTTACVLAEIKCFDICLIISGTCEMPNTNSKHNVIILDFNFVQLFTLVLHIQDPETARVFW